MVLSYGQSIEGRKNGVFGTCIYVFRLLRVKVPYCDEINHLSGFEIVIDKENCTFDSGKVHNFPIKSK